MAKEGKSRMEADIPKELADKDIQSAKAIASLEETHGRGAQEGCWAVPVPPLSVPMSGN